MLIRNIEIKNFRGLKELVWTPKLGVNCLIGPGDSGKSTILDAIDLAMSARRQYVFSDSDFHLHNTSKPIDIKITIGQLNTNLLNIERYGRFHRGFDATTATITDEPLAGAEVVMTLRLCVKDDLEPIWSLYSERAERNEEERNLAWAHRQEISPLRLGAYSAHHMAWGTNSVLNKMSADKASAASALAAAARQARQTFSEIGCDGVDDVLKTVNVVAQRLGISTLNSQALLDIRGASFSGGAIALHDDKNVPLRNLGTGSSRLLVSGLQAHDTTASITLIDEVEHGLEPYRILRLLDELGAKTAKATTQVFMTTHSPVVLRELKAEQLSIVRVESIPLPPNLASDEQSSVVINSVFSLTGSLEEEQKLLRTNAEAFLTPSIIVCEGKTEIGLMRGLDFYFTECGKRSLMAHGCYWADGGGDPSLFDRARIFAKLGYRVAILMDSDVETAADNITEMQASRISIFRWPDKHSTESVIFKSIPAQNIPQLLSIACEWKSVDSIDARIKKTSGGTYSLEQCRDTFQEDMRPMLGSAAGKGGDWYKDIEPAERVMREIICPNWKQSESILTTTLGNLIQWVRQAPTAQPERSKS